MILFFNREHRRCRHRHESSRNDVNGIITGVVLTIQQEAALTQMAAELADLKFAPLMPGLSTPLFTPTTMQQWTLLRHHHRGSGVVLHHSAAARAGRDGSGEPADGKLPL
jgi:hypothetical protein